MNREPRLTRRSSRPPASGAGRDPPRFARRRPLNANIRRPRGCDSQSVSRSFTRYPSKGEVFMPTNTIRLHRVVRATPERIYRAFLEADAIAKWLPPNGFTGKVHQLDATVGGTYQMSFTNFATGKSHSFGGTYLELVPHERIRYTDKFDDPNLPSEMQTTITLKKVSCGTEMN